MVKVREFANVFTFTLSCLGSAEVQNQQIFTDPNIPISADLRGGLEMDGFSISLPNQTDCRLAVRPINSYEPRSQNTVKSLVKKEKQSTV